MRTFLLAIAMLAVTAPSAIAQKGQKIQMADCTTSGCTCRVSNLTLNEVLMTVTITVPKGAEDMILVTNPAGELGWSSMAPADLDLLYGGPGSCPLQLFDEMAPEDGMWQITTGVSDGSACPMLGGAAGAPPLSGAARQIRWGGTFHPDALMSEAAGTIRWSSTGPRRWRGVLAAEAASGSAGATAASVVWALTLVSPREIRGSSVFDYSISSNAGDAAVNALLGGLACKTQTPFVATLVK